MKYEAVFGDQSLFDDAPEDAEMAASVCQMPKWYTMFNGKVLFCDSKKESWQSADFNHPGSPLLAMRRIIKEPKRWTWEDKRAGRLPEIGVSVVGVTSHNEKFVVYVDDDAVVVKHKQDQDVVVVFNHSLFLTAHNPIETPAEKAQREEDEFVDVIVSEYNKMPSSISFKDGIRAAYRKLKGGER